MRQALAGIAVDVSVRATRDVATTVYCVLVGELDVMSVRESV
jgi:hypothetical protein